MIWVAVPVASDEFDCVDAVPEPMRTARGGVQSAPIVSTSVDPVALVSLTVAWVAWTRVRPRAAMVGSEETVVVARPVVGGRWRPRPRGTRAR